VIALRRRQFLASTLAAIGSAAVSKLAGHAAIAAEPDTTILRVERRTIEVNGRAAKVFGLLQPDGRPGISTQAGRRFRVRLENRSEAPTLIHWHGLLAPYGQDGVPDLPQPLLPSGQAYDYDFPLDTPGTHWMHAHTLQEQQLLAAPLIVADRADSARDEQEVVVLLHDFSFKSPEELLADLSGGTGMTGMAGDDGTTEMDNMGDMATGGMVGMSDHSMTMDINDIDYDAYLANDRTLEDPEVFRVEPGGLVRLRLINGATATAFWIALGELHGEAFAVDGNPVTPVVGRLFPLAMGQRIDIRVRVPKKEGAWPVFALREGAMERTGFMLATKAGIVQRVGPEAERPAAPLDLDFEGSLGATQPLAENPPDRQDAVTLGGDMATYAWTIDGRAWGRHRPIPVSLGQRVEVTVSNQSMMGHPIHLHGHHFQVVAIDGQRFSGAMRDTVWVPPMHTVTVAFDAGNPGVWAFHCHHLYHMAAGMMTAVAYQA